MRRLPIGIESFKEMIDHHNYYVDKTSLIEDVCKEKVIFYTRPRRFGKTLNMSMLYYFFSIQQKENAYLFDGLKIAEDTVAMEKQNQYPVIFLTFKDMKNDSFEKQLAMFSLLIQEIIRNNQELLSSDKINEFDKERMIRLYRGTKDEVELQNALKFISGCLEQHYDRKVIILIDEYDVPLQNAYLNGYYDAMAVFLRNVFSATLKTNDALEKGILSGCLRIAKESIFTGLNNFKVNSIFDETSSGQFGFTQQEIDVLLDSYHLSVYKDDIKEWYDGYLFGSQEIYNPWSVLMYMDKLLTSSKNTPISFWANTSGNDIIYRYVKEADVKMREEFDTLISGRFIEKPIKDNLTYREMDQISNVYSFLLYTGYLKAIACVNEERNIYQLMIPNREIKQIYISIFSEWFEEQVVHNGSAFVEALRKGEVGKATELLNSILFQSISYFDYDEKFYHGLLLGMLNDYQVASNQETGLGRADIIIYPRTLDNRGLVLELKIATSLADLKPMAKKACEQIKNQKYIEGLLANGYEDIHGYGLAFYKKSCVITSLCALETNK